MVVLSSELSDRNYQIGVLSFFYFGENFNVVIVNGVGLDIAGKTLQEYLESAGYNFKQIAGSVVFKTLYATTILCDNDIIEIVCFVGGG